jgi:hypothetical protein
MGKRIIDDTPAAYPITNTPEIKAVAALYHILDTARIKPFVNSMDKVPNVDGHFEIVDESQQPMGKIEVQVKYLSQKNRSRPRYQCEKKFLAYCEDSILPVLLIVVDPEQELAYWFHISLRYLKTVADRIKGRTVNIDLPLENKISKSDNSYLLPWTDILGDYRTRLIDFESVNTQLIEMKAAHKKLLSITNPVLGIERDYFKELHFFLDYYNSLLDNDFLIIKEIFYENCWKIGIAYSVYTESSLSYSLYPISYSANDIQIKEISGSKKGRLKNVINYVNHNTNNPIKYTPEKYAYKYIIKDLKNILDKRMLLPINKYAANEYITAFLDSFSQITGLKENSSSYKLQEIKFALNNFIPSLCQEYLKAMDSSPEGFFCIDLFLHFDSEEIEVLKQRAAKRLGAEENQDSAVDIFSNKFNLVYLHELIRYLENFNESSVNRIYPLKKYPKSRAYFSWEVYNQKALLSVMNVILKNLPKLYDDFISEYFPGIKDRISFFSYFDRLIVNVSVKEKSIDLKDSPEVELIYLQNISMIKEQRIDIYAAGIDKSPLTVRDCFLNKDTIVVIDDAAYKICGGLSSKLKGVYNELPMQDYIYWTLNDRMKHYLDSFPSGGSGF